MERNKAGGLGSPLAAVQVEETSLNQLQVSCTYTSVGYNELGACRTRVQIEARKEAGCLLAFGMKISLKGIYLIADDSFTLLFHIDSHCQVLILYLVLWGFVTFLPLC